MADQRPPSSPRFPLRVAVVGVLTSLGALFAACGGGETCDNGTCVSQSGTRLIDRICRQSVPGGAACEASGGALQTTGITGDSSGYQLNGPSATLTVHLAAL